MLLGFLVGRCVCRKSSRTAAIRARKKAKIFKKDFFTSPKTLTISWSHQTGSKPQPLKSTLALGARSRKSHMLQALICLDTRINTRTFYALLRTILVSHFFLKFRIPNVKRVIGRRISDADCAEQSTRLDDCHTLNYGQEEPHRKAPLLLRKVWPLNRSFASGSSVDARVIPIHN